MSDNSDNAEIQKALEQLQVDLADNKCEIRGVKRDVHSVRDLISDLIGIYSGKRVRK